jgi:S-DNA-T family DNA segregation ATPase FtsK/SpoIIIE
VTLGDILATDDAAAASHPLEVGLGRDIAGRSQMANLATFPHVLIAGATGAGKSSCINSIVTSILMRSTPDQVRLILVDPKRVELGVYNGLPHLLTEVVTNPKKAANALEWAVREMDMRYELLAEVGVRDITGYNAMYDRGELPTTSKPDPALGKTYERLPFIVLVVDELNDLMMVAARDVEASICRVAQMARAVGIHLVIATQRPSVDVITGVIKANVPSRLAFSVSSLADSRVILDQPGAEKLIGQGDMLVLSASTNRAQRVQGAWVDEECVRKVVAHWRRQVSAPSYVEGLQGDDSPSGGRAGDDVDDDDELLGEAMELVVRSGLGSTSMLQRKLRVGFARAGRLIDLLERRGVVGPSEGSKARAVLMTVEEFEQSHDRV